MTLIAAQVSEGSIRMCADDSLDAQDVRYRCRDKVIRHTFLGLGDCLVGFAGDAGPISKITRWLTATPGLSVGQVADAMSSFVGEEQCLEMLVAHREGLHVLDHTGACDELATNYCAIGVGAQAAMAVFAYLTPSPASLVDLGEAVARVVPNVSETVQLYSIEAL